jgi:CubicO group peptidase (beta-lactamase class C family)
VLRPLGLTRSGFTRQALGGADFAEPHDVDNDGKTVPAPGEFYLPRSCRPFGGVLSSITDQLAYARFHLGDGRAPSGERLMRAESLQAMRSDPGPGGTLIVELDGYGVSWMLRPTAEGPIVVQHGGDLPGYHSGFMMVPDRDFAMTLLTNSDSGKQLVGELFYKDWALRRFAGVGNLPAEPRPLGAAELAAYEGSYTARQIGFTGPPFDTTMRMAGADGALQMVEGTGGDTTPATVLRFYREDFVLVGDTGLRADFLRDAAGRVAWFRLGGRLFRRES